MSEAGATITALSKEFDRSVIQTKPGSDRKPATKYVSHGSVTKRLNTVCPGWSSRVVEMHTYMDQKGIMKCAGVTLELSIPGVGSRQEFGTASQPRDFGTDAKNAMSDALKRCAMRFGVAIDLWEDMDEDDEDAQPRTQQANSARQSRPAASPPASSSPSSKAAAAPSAAATPPYSDSEYNKVIDGAWALGEDGRGIEAIKDYLNRNRHRMSPKQRNEAVAELGKIEARFYTPAGVAG